MARAAYYILNDQGDIWNYQRRRWQWFHSSPGQAYVADEKTGSKRAERVASKLMDRYKLGTIHVVHESELPGVRSALPWGGREE